MCEFTKSEKITQTDTDIYVFKVFIRLKYGKWQAPVYDKIYKRNILHTAKINVIHCKAPYINFLTETGLYSFDDEKHARKYKDYLTNNNIILEKYVIVKCLIPKGSRVIICGDKEHKVGEHGAHIIVSNQLIPLKEIKNV